MEWKEKNNPKKTRPPTLRLVWKVVAQTRESQTHKHLKNCFFKKKAVVKLFLLSFLPMRKKESNITFLFAKERCQKLIFTFFCKATKESETKEKCLCPRFAKLAMHLLRFRERWTHEHLASFILLKFLYSFFTLPYLFLQGARSNNTALKPHLRRHCYALLRYRAKYWCRHSFVGL